MGDEEDVAVASDTRIKYHDEKWCTRKMNLSAKTEYACLALLELALPHNSQKLVQGRLIAERHGIPAAFLVQILQRLKQAGLINSTRGKSGGYILARSPKYISLTDVLDIIEGSANSGVPAAEGSPLAPLIQDVCNELAEARRESLKTITISDLIERANVGESLVWCI